MRRGLLLLSIVLIAVAVAPVATANQPDRHVVNQGDDVIPGCAFPVLVHVEGYEIHKDFTDKAGNLVKAMAVFPGNKLTLTNLDTGKSITLMGTGLFLARLETDGSGSVKFTGHGPAPPITDEPGLWYFTGQVSVTFDANGNPTSVHSSGKQVDLCTQLAPS